VDDADVKTTAALMPTSGQWTGYLSPQGLVEFVRYSLDSFMPPGFPKINIPDYPQSPPVGATAKMLSVGLETHLVIPQQVLSTAGQYVVQVQAAQAGRGPNGPGNQIPAAPLRKPVR